MTHEIMSSRVPADQNRSLLSRLLTRGNRAYSHFLDIIEVTYPHIYTVLRQTERDVEQAPRDQVMFGMSKNMLHCYIPGIDTKTQ